MDWIAAEAAKAADPDAEAHGSHPGCTSPEACAPPGPRAERRVV